MPSLAPTVPISATHIERAAAVAGLFVTALIAVAIARHDTSAAAHPVAMSPWLIIHLVTIIPAMPLGAFVLFRPKGDRLHRLCGRIWAGLMVIAAISSFGIVELMGHLSPIHLLSVLTLVSVPRAILAIRAGKVWPHRRAMTIVYVSSVVAGLFVFLPTRMLGRWLVGM